METTELPGQGWSTEVYPWLAKGIHCYSKLMPGPLGGGKEEITSLPLLCLVPLEELGADQSVLPAFVAPATKGSHFFPVLSKFSITMHHLCNQKFSEWGKNKFAVVSTQNRVIFLLLFINYCITFHTNNCKPVFEPPPHIVYGCSHATVAGWISYGRECTDQKS